MEIEVLGPLTAQVRGRSFVPSAAKPRQILALLALSPGRVVPVPALIEELWDCDPPRTATTTLQGYVVQLRRLLEAASGSGPSAGPSAGTPTAKQVLVHRHGGYQLCVPPEVVDVHAYDRQVALAQAAADRADDASASRHYRAALSLWRGRLLLDVPIGPMLELELVRFEESRLGVLERRLDAELRLGLHDQVLTELAWLTARHPMHEGLHAQSMVAHCRAGRQWRALEIYQSLRRALAGELGLDPSPRLQRLHQAVLTGDPALLRPDASRRPALDLYAA